MNDSNEDRDDNQIFSSSVHRIRRVESRLDAVCDLIDLELDGGGVDEVQLQGFARRMAADIDHVMAEETHWVRRSRCEV